jgi:glycosyltransferase involved in cell wall biosynthesis
MKKISIVTAIHNQIEYNTLFIESLERYSYYPYELIIIDNASNDGSTELFRKHGATVLRNEVNKCYGCSQNQGIANASGDYIAFLNNDICLSLNWDKKLIDYMDAYALDVMCPSGIETMESVFQTKRYMRRWRRINAFQRLRVLLGIHYSAKSLWFLIRLMYGNWERYNEKRAKCFKEFLFPGIAGNAVVARRSVFDRIGLWSTSVPASDWDLQLRLVKRQTEIGDVKQSMIAGDVFVHHFIRATFRATKKKFSCTHIMQPITSFYSKEDLVYLNRPSVSLLITVSGTADMLDSLLICLCNQTVPDFEIIIIDTSDDEQCAHLTGIWKNRFMYPVVYVAGKSISHESAAVRLARGAFVCFVDGNCLVHHKFIEAHINSSCVGAYSIGHRCIVNTPVAAMLTPEYIKTMAFEKMSDSDTQQCTLPAQESKSRNENISLHTGDYYRALSFLTDNMADIHKTSLLDCACIRQQSASAEAMQYRIETEK